MQKNLLKRHLTISFLVLLVLIVVLFFSSLFAREVFTNPQKYIYTELSTIDIQFAIVCIFFIITIVLISYVVYLILGSKSRVELEVWREIKDLASSREQFKKLYEDAPIPYVMLNEKGEMHEPNKSALRFFGVLPEEIQGKVLFLFHPEEEIEHGKKLLQSYKLNIPINREEIRMITKNDDVRWVSLSIFHMKDPNTGIRTGLATILDVTEQKKLDKAKTEFVSLASHQLRTPLATMKWFMDMLGSGQIGDLPVKQKEYVNKLYSVNEEMISLVDNLLNVSRIEIGSLAVSQSFTDIEALTESVLVELSEQISKKEIKINRQYNNLFHNIKTDPKLLRIVIQNLISNAVKYTPNEGVVTIAFEESIGKREIRISDTGVGIPSKEQTKVFTKLFRADNIKNDSNTQGTGLGLYLVKSIVESLKGKIYFISEENKGSTFTISLDMTL